MTRALRRMSRPGCFPLPRIFDTTLEAQRKLTRGLDSPHVFCYLAGVRAGKRFSYSGFYKAWKRPFERLGWRTCRTISGGPQSAISSATACPRSVAMSMVGQKTEEVYRRYAIVDQAMLGEAAVKMTDGRRFGELLHNELHNRIGHR